MADETKEHEDINLHIRKSTFWISIVCLLWTYIAVSILRAIFKYVPDTKTLIDFFSLGVIFGVIILGFSIIAIPLYLRITDRL